MIKTVSKFRTNEPPKSIDLQFVGNVAQELNSKDGFHQGVAPILPTKPLSPLN